MLRHHGNAYWVTTVVVCGLLVAASGCGDDRNPVSALVASAPGESARDFLSDERYTALTIQVQPVQGKEPDPDSIHNLQGFLESRLNKPGGIEVVVAPGIPATEKAVYSLAEIRQIEIATRTAFPGGNTAAAYLLFIDGDSDQSNGTSRILGHAYGSSSMVVYQNAVVELSGGIGQPGRAVVETTVASHELGHILGLVGNGSAPVDPGHHDHDNGAHCANQDCLMYYAADLSDVIANLLGGSIPTLDTDCVNDLRANGGR
jgi:hypothetical protein